MGLSSALGAIILKSFAFFIHSFIAEKIKTEGAWKYIYILFPAIGILLAVWIINRFFKTEFLKGIDKIVFAIAKKSSLLPRSQIYSHVITGGVTIGFGGSSGLESPIVSTGAAIGSNFARNYHLSYKERTLLLACGVAAGIAAAFNAPIAGVLFVVEVLLIDISINSFIPLIVAAASGALLSQIILKEGILLSFNSRLPFNYANVPFYIILGILAGFISLYYSKLFTALNTALYKWKSKYIKAIIGSLLLAILILFFPTLFGEGYTSITSLATMHPERIFENSIIHDFFTNEWMIIAGVLTVMLLKVFATAFTIGGGGNGGNFAPSLFTGAYLGFGFASVLNTIGFKTPVGNFTLVAMAGILSGVFYAPLTAIFLIAEITGGYELMIPLMIVSAISYTIVKSFQPMSMEMKKLSENESVHTHDKDKYLLSKLEIGKILETDHEVLYADKKLSDILPLILNSTRDSFAVINKANRLTGVIELTNIKSVLIKKEMHHKIFVKELMQKPAATIEITEHLHTIIEKFDQTGATNLPVVNNKEFAGFVSRSALLNEYRQEFLNSM